MSQERAPEREQSLVGNGAESTSWEVARERLANPEHQRTSWLATTRPDGRPHLMPVIASWIDGAIHLVVGEGTRKARNLAANDRCVIATSSTTLPSLDIVLEGRADPLTDHDEVRHIAEVLTASGWPLEAKEDKVYGPNAPTAGPAPYTIFRLVPSKGFGLPGMHGMDESDPADLPRPTRWDFGNGEPDAA
jgi:nitroimidazol reductase NimA-like FMN-containing flavoprotein (pyridoxamine 5'-phosphate oxidase superfamily)